MAQNSQQMAEKLNKDMAEIEAAMKPDPNAFISEAPDSPETRWKNASVHYFDTKRKENRAAAVALAQAQPRPLFLAPRTLF